MYTGSKVYRFICIKVQRITDLYVYRFKGLQVYMYTGSKNYRFIYIQVQRFTGFYVYRFKELQAR